MSDVKLIKMSSDENEMDDSDNQQVKKSNPPRRGRGILKKIIHKDVEEAEDESVTKKTPRRGRRRSLRIEDGNEDEGNNDEHDSNKEIQSSERDRGRRTDREMREIIEIEEEEDSDTQDINVTKSPRSGRGRSKKIDSNISDAGKSPSRGKVPSHTSEEENEVIEENNANECAKKVKNSSSRGRGARRGKGRGRGKKIQDNKDDDVNDMEDSDIELISTTSSPRTGRGQRQKKIKKFFDDEASEESPSRGRFGPGKSDDEKEDEKDIDFSVQVKESPDKQKGNVRGKGRGSTSDKNVKPNNEDDDQKDDECNSLEEGLDLCPEDFMIEEEAESNEDQAQNICPNDSAVEEETSTGEDLAQNNGSEESKNEEEEEVETATTAEDQVQNIVTNDSIIEEEKDDTSAGEDKARNMGSEDFTTEEEEYLVEESKSGEKQSKNICAEDYKIGENTNPCKDEDQNIGQDNQEHEEHTDFIDFGVEETDLYESEEDNFEDTEENPSNNSLPLEEDKKKEKEDKKEEKDDKKEEKSIQDMEEDQIVGGKIQDPMQSKKRKEDSVLSRLGPPIKRNNNQKDDIDESDNESADDERKSKRSKVMSEREDLTNSPVKDGEQEQAFIIPGMCFKFNIHGRCQNRNCKWPHRCDECGGDHPKCKCIIRKQRREKDKEKKNSSKELGLDLGAKDGDAKQKTTRMFVNSKSKNLRNVSGTDMRRAFIQFGAIKSVTIPRHCGFAFIEFEDPESLDRAIEFGEKTAIRVKGHILNPGQPSISKGGESGKRKAPDDLQEKIKHAKTGNQESIPRTKRKKLYCNVCQIPLGFMSLEDHVECSRHDDNVVRVSNLLGLDRKFKFEVDSAIKTSIEINFVKKLDNSDNGYSCLICSSNFDDRKELGEHLNNNSHKKITEKVFKNYKDTLNPPIYIKDLNSGQSSISTQATERQKTELQKSEPEKNEDNLSTSRKNQELSQHFNENKDAETFASDIFTSSGHKSKEEENEEIAFTMTKSINSNENDNSIKRESMSDNDHEKSFTEELPEENKDKIESSCDKKEIVKLSIPSDKCENITGKGGIELLALCNQSKAEISFDESTRSAKHGLFNIKGTKKQIEIARQLIFEKVGVISSQSIHEFSGERDEAQQKLESANTKASSGIKSIYFALPAKKCGQVIGKARCELNNISQKTGAMITIDKESQKNKLLRTFVIKGTQEQIKEAKEMMTERANANLSVGIKINHKKESNVKKGDVLSRVDIRGIPGLTLLPGNVPLQQTKIMQQMIPNPVVISGVPLQPMQPMLAKATPPILSSLPSLLGPPPKVMKQKPPQAFPPPPPSLQSNVIDYSHRAGNVADYSHAHYLSDYSHGTKKEEMDMSQGILGAAPAHGVQSFHDTSSDLTPVPMKEDSDDDLPSDINIAKSKLFIGNLPKGISEEIMKKLLNICGEVQDLECELVDGYIESCCTVTFKKVVSVYHAHRHLNGTTFMDKKIIATILLKDVQKENESKASYHKSDQSIIRLILDNYVSDMKSSSTNRSGSPARYRNAKGDASNSRNNQRSRSPLNKNESKHGRQREIHRSKSPKHEKIHKQSAYYEETLYSSKKNTGREFAILNLNQEIGENLLIPMLKECSQITNYVNKQGQFVLKFGDGEIAVLLAKVLNGTRFPDRCLVVGNFDSILQSNVNDLKLNVMENFVSDGFKNNQHRFITFWQSLSKSSEDIWMNWLMMDNWRDAYVAGLGKTYHILVESIIKLNKYRINTQANDGVYVLVVTPTAFIAQCLTAAVQRIALENKQYVVNVTEDQFGTDGGSVVVGTASGIMEMMCNSSWDICATLKVLILDDASRLMIKQMDLLRNITNTLIENSIKLYSRINFNKITVVETENQQEVNSLSTLLKCQLFVEGSSSAVPRSHMVNQSGFSRPGQTQISRLDANQPDPSFQKSRGSRWSSTKQGESSTKRFGSKEVSRNPRSVHSGSIQKGLSDTNEEPKSNAYYGLNLKQIAHATLGKDSIVTKDLIRTYLKAQGVNPVQEIVFHIASAVYSEQLKLNDGQPPSKSHNNNDWQLDLEEVGDEINDDGKANTMSGFKQGNKDLTPKYGSSGREHGRGTYGSDQQSGLLKRPDNRLPHGSNQQSTSLPKQDTSSRSYGSRGKEDDRLLRMSGTIKQPRSLPISDTSGRTYGSQGRVDDSLMQRHTQDQGLLPMPDTSGRSFSSRVKEDENLMQKNTQQLGLLPMPDTSGGLYSSQGRADDSFVQRNPKQPGLLSMPDSSGRSYGSRGRENDGLMQRSSQQSGLLPMPDTSGRSYGSQGRVDDSLMQRYPQQPETMGRPYGSRGREDDSLMQRSYQQPGLLSMPDTSDRSYGSRSRADDRLLMGETTQPSGSYGSIDRGREDDRVRSTSRFDRMEPTSGSSLLSDYSSKGSQDEYRERMYMRRESGSGQENIMTARERLPMNRSLPDSYYRY